MGFFDGAQIEAGVTNVQDEVEKIQKALTAGYGTDSSQFSGGRALIPEDLEGEVISVVSMLKDDCKAMNTMKTTPVRSTVHEVNLRLDHGDWKHITVEEGGESVDSDQTIDRKTYPVKYMQARRAVTKQMELVDTFEGALASEKIAGIETIIKSAEYQCFQGDAAIIPTQFDGFLAAIRKAPAAERNIINLAGKTVGSYGAKVFDEISAMVRQQGGILEKAFFPIALSKDVKEMFADKMRYVINQPLGNLSFKAIPDYGTSTGATIALSGDGAGDDLFYEVKGTVVAEGNAAKRPAAPASVTAAAAAGAASAFTASDAGDYNYAVHAVNAYGISAGTEVSGAVTVAGGNVVTLTITPGTGPRATGFIICRSKKDGTEVMEMDKIPNRGEATTTFVDKNEELPGTASMLFLPKQRFQPVYAFGQLLPASTFPLYPTNRAETPFLVMMYGSLEVRAPKHCGLVKNIAYSGGLY